MEENEMYHVLLYYKFVPIEDEETFAAEHLEACNNLGLKGRILVSKDGINGTASGPVSQTDAYIEMMRKDRSFKDMECKTDEHDGHAFKNMHFRPRNELRLRVSLSKPDDHEGQAMKKIHVRLRQEVLALRLNEDEETNPDGLAALYVKPVEFYE